MAVDYTDDDYIFDTHWLALKRAIDGAAIVSGFDMTPVSGMQINIAAGVYRLQALTGSIRRSFTIGNQTVPAADVTYDRWDLICSKTSSPYWQYLTGTPGAIPKPPDLPAAQIIIGMVYVPAGTTTITASMLRNFGFKNAFLEHEHDGTHCPQIDFSNILSSQHPIGGSTYHSASTLAQLNALISDATLDDDGDPRDPNMHDHTKHTDRERQVLIPMYQGTVRPGSASTGLAQFFGGIGTLTAGQAAIEFQKIGSYTGWWLSPMWPLPKVGIVDWNRVTGQFMRILFTGIDTTGVIYCNVRVQFYKEGNIPVVFSKVITAQCHPQSQDGEMTSEDLNFNNTDINSIPIDADFVQVSMQRMSSHAVDTYPNSFYVHGFRIKYTADQ